MTEHSFVLFGWDHVAVLWVITLAVVALMLNRTRLRALDDRVVRRAVSVVLLSNELMALMVGWMQGRARVPLQLCDLALFCTIWVLWHPTPVAGEVAYFWGLGGSLQAILTPDLRQRFPDYWWITFFITHGGVVVSVVYLALMGHVAPTHRSVWRLWLLTNGYAAIVGLMNWAWGTNYGYLAHKPQQPSLLDYGGPWPYYIVMMEAVALFSFYLYYAPFVVAKRVARR